MNKKAEEYRELFDGFIVASAPAPNGDFDAFCPAHENPATSKKPSARINFTPTNTNRYPNGMISCFVCNFSGKDASLDNIAKLYRQRVESGVNFEKYDRQESHHKFGKTGKKLALPDILTRLDYQRHLLSTPSLLEPLMEKRGLSRETIRRFQVGWAQIKSAYCYPVREGGTGAVTALRLYRLDANAEVRHNWFNSEGVHTPQLFGIKDMENEPVVVLLEGEWDAMLGQQDGFKAISHNGGAGKFKQEWTPFFRDKVVYIAYDSDDAGRKGRTLVANMLKTITKAIYFIDFPNPTIDGKVKSGTDYTDYRIRDGHSASDFADLMADARRDGPVSSNVISGLPINGKPVNIAKSTASQYIGEPLEMTVQVIGKFDGYIVPNRVLFSCTADKGENICAGCVMQTGSGELNIEKDSDLVQRMIETRAPEIDKLLVREVGAKCRDRITEIKREGEWSVEKVIVGESVETRHEETPETLGESNQNMIIHNVDQHDSDINEIYRVVGRNVANPKDQHTMFLTWIREATKTNIDKFVMTQDIMEDLMIFQPDHSQSPLDKMREIAKDLGLKVAGVVEREQLIMAYDIVWHSALAFYLGQKLDDRGWVELLVFGDTRTGKTATAQAIANHYRHGRVFSSEGATRAGLVGGATQPSGAKNWVATWGVLPNNDRRLIVLDEAQSLQSLVKDISSIRSKGKAEIVKVGINASTMARTRLIWITNPVGQEKLSELSNGAMTALNEFMPASEDRARFDLGVALSHDDVSQTKIVSGVMSRPGETKYTSEACEALILWAWSRKPEQIIWGKGAIDAVMQQAIQITDKYKGDFELVQESNMHVKLARISVAVAARVFSASKDGQNLIVEKKHVESARDFLYECYDNRSFGLKRAAQKMKDDSRIAESSLEDVRQWFRHGDWKGIVPVGIDVYNGIRNLDSARFDRRDFGSITGLPIQDAQLAFSYLRDNALVKYDANASEVKLSKELQELLLEMKYEDD